MSDVNGAIKLPMRPANDEIPNAWLLQYKSTLSYFTILLLSKFRGTLRNTTPYCEVE